MGILIFKGLTARRLYKSFVVKGLNSIPSPLRSSSSYYYFLTIPYSPALSFLFLTFHPSLFEQRAYTYCDLVTHFLCFYFLKLIPEAARPKAWVCGMSLAGTAGSNPSGAWKFASCVCCVLSGRSLSLAQRSLTKCGVSNECDREAP
jgi:hypothetical protein